MRQGDQRQPGIFRPQLAAAGFIHYAQLHTIISTVLRE